MLMLAIINQWILEIVPVKYISSSTAKPENVIYDCEKSCGKVVICGKKTWHLLQQIWKGQGRKRENKILAAHYEILGDKN